MKCSKWSPVSLAVALVSLSAPGVHAQDCECDHSVAPEVGSINGADLGVSPGQVVCIEAGARDFLRIYEMSGTADDPIVIKNCGGQVVIDNSDRGYGLTLEGSSYVRITGTGDDAVPYGFQVRASKDGPDYSASCIVANGMSTNYEIDHIEAYECGFAGVSAKTDPTCDDQDLSYFVQRDSSLHHLYLHDTGGEGIYFGNTGYPSRAGTCDGAPVDLIPHTHEGVYIYDNTIEDTGWDGAQVGVSPKDCFVYRNRISRVGLDMEEYQMQGLQIGGGSACQVFDNFIAHGPATGIIVLDAADTAIYNNVIVDFVDGIYLNDRDSPVTEGAHYWVIHNTVVSAAERGIAMFGARTSGSVFSNNLIVAGGTNPLGIGSEVDATQAGNVILDAVADALFVDDSGEDYSLNEGSPAIDQGVSTSDWMVTTDQRGAPRDDAPDAGAFEFGAEAPDEETPLPKPGTNPSPPELSDDPAGEDTADGSDSDSDSGASTDDGGCSCRAAPSTGAPGWGFLALLFVGAIGARRRYTTCRP